MSMIFQFRALSDENDNFLRDYQVMYNATLQDFHDFICDDLGFDRESMASFHLSDKQWGKLREFTLIDMGGVERDGPLPMESVTLSEIIRDNGDRLIYTFDIFADRSLYMEMVGAYKAGENAEYPCTICSEGGAPEQFRLTATNEDPTIFDETMVEFGGLEYNDGYQVD